MIKCWDEAIPQMRKGEKATLQCPSDMAYGVRGAGGAIPPNSNLIVEVEVLDWTGGNVDL